MQAGIAAAVSPPRNDSVRGIYADRLEDDLRVYVSYHFREITCQRQQQLTHQIALGAAYGTAKSGIGIAGVGTFRPDLIMKVWQIQQLAVRVQRTSC